MRLCEGLWGVLGVLWVLGWQGVLEAWEMGCVRSDFLIELLELRDISGSC